MIPAPCGTAEHPVRTMACLFLFYRILNFCMPFRVLGRLCRNIGMQGNVPVLRNEREGTESNGAGASPLQYFTAKKEYFAYSTALVATMSTPVPATLASSTSPISTGALAATCFSAAATAKIFPLGISWAVLQLTTAAPVLLPVRRTVLVTMRVGLVTSLQAYSLPRLQVKPATSFTSPPSSVTVMAQPKG